MTTIEHKNIDIYNQVLYSWQDSKQLLDVFHRFPAEFKNDPFLVAVMHHHQCFNQVDFDKSLKMYVDLVSQNHPYAMNNLAYMYQHGYEVDVDVKKAINLYERAIVWLLYMKMGKVFRLIMLKPLNCINGLLIWIIQEP